MARVARKTYVEHMIEYLFTIIYYYTLFLTSLRGTADNMINSSPEYRFHQIRGLYVVT